MVAVRDTVECNTTMLFTPGMLDPFTLDYDGDRPTWPPVGTRELVIEDKCEALFYSAVWTVQARVDDQVLARSPSTDNNHSHSYVRRWARQAIRSRYIKLRQLGVDADSEYVKFGGKPEDLRS